MIGSLARLVQGSVPTADLDDRDPDYIRDNLPGLWLLATIWHRAEVRGLEHIPEQGPVLLVGNHSGGNASPDTLIFTLAFSAWFGVERRFHQLAHNLVVSYPGIGAMLRRFGNWEVSRPSCQSARIDFGGRRGFLRLALEERVPIVPVVSIGGQETALFLGRGEALARLLRIDRAFRMKTLPISLAVPWGLNVGDLLSHLPFPAKITIQCLPPIDLEQWFGPDPQVDDVYESVVTEMQEALSRLAAERRFPLVG
ncbi:MAG: glycerol acyltransferase [Chloroflexi bacterium]|nr:MAG: glycerol acyltransferase [Chloroflexota bacterium]